LGLAISYAEQPKPEGLAQAFIIGADFIGSDPVCLILGDNIFYGAGLQEQLRQAREKAEQDQQAVVFGYYVEDPERYGVAAFDEQGTVLAIEEKPKAPKSNYAIVGLYFYPNSVIGYAKKVQPSERGELEITSINQTYLNRNELQLQLLGRGYAWLDTGTHESLSEATEFIKTIEKRTSLKVACLEEIALLKGYITKEQLSENIQGLKGVYYEYLHKLIK